MLRQLDSLPSDPAAAAAIRSLLGESDQGTSSDEIAWGFRKLLEERAEKAALVCLFDDIHWAEETFLDLVEHVADLSRDAPLLLLCIGRPELLDRRPSWGGGKLNATTVLLEPLSAEETDRLLDQLGGIGAEMAAKIRRVAEGNPLFVEEMLALVRESPNVEVEVPPTIHALLAARLDQLEPAERDVLARGSVEGRVFHRGAVQALSSQEAQVPQRLIALVRKELVRPDKTQLPGEDAYRFRHVLIRDAAYDALPKATRAELHERFADWLAEHGGDLVELDEILGHHLEQAARYRTELGWDSSELAEKAGSRLAAAGRRALWRGDDGGAIHLLERSLELIRSLRLDVDLELDLASAYQWRDPRQATEIAESVVRRAADAGDSRGEALSGAAAVTAQMSYEPDIDELERRARAALELIELTDYSGQVVVWTALGLVANFRGHSEDWADAGERALRASRAAGQRYGHLFGLGPALVYGTRPADEALSLLEELALEISHPRPALQRARLLAMLGRLEEARDVALDAAARLAEMQEDAEETLAVIAEYRGEYEEAVRHQEAVVADLETLDQSSFLSTEAARLARYLCMADRYDEAETFARRAREVGDEQDQATQTLWRQAQALIHAHRGEQDEAERLAREAVELAETTDILDAQGDALRDLGEVLALAGRVNEAAAALEKALARFERKKDLVKATEAQRRLEELRSEARA